MMAMRSAGKSHPQASTGVKGKRRGAGGGLVTLLDEISDNVKLPLQTCGVKCCLVKLRLGHTPSSSTS